jgi:hypothetical protein
MSYEWPEVFTPLAHFVMARTSRAMTVKDRNFRPLVSGDMSAITEPERHVGAPP